MRTKEQGDAKFPPWKSTLPWQVHETVFAASLCVAPPPKALERAFVTNDRVNTDDRKQLSRRRFSSCQNKRPSGILSFLLKDSFLFASLRSMFCYCYFNVPVDKQLLAKNSFFSIVGKISKIGKVPNNQHVSCCEF